MKTPPLQTPTDRGIVLIGYSGHARVVHETFLSMGRLVVGYCDLSIRDGILHDIEYLGNESDEPTLAALRCYDYFVCLGDNISRERLQRYLSADRGPPINAVHPTAIVSTTATLGQGILLGPGSVVNANVRIGDGAIVNSGAVMEHDCEIGAFSHICPNATLTGHVQVGRRSLVGAGAVVIPGKRIGDDATVGAGSVVVRDVSFGCRVAGNPAKIIDPQI